MTVARAWKCGSSLPAIFSWTAFTDSASMRAWAGSYTPQGRSQWALTLTLGANRRESMERSFLVIVFSHWTLLRGRHLFAGAPTGLGQKSGVRLRLVEERTGEVPEDAGAVAGRRAVECAAALRGGGGDRTVHGAHAAPRGPAPGALRGPGPPGCRGGAAPSVPAGPAGRQAGHRAPRGRLVGARGQHVRRGRQHRLRDGAGRAGAGQGALPVPAPPGRSALPAGAGGLGALRRPARAVRPPGLQAGGQHGPGDRKSTRLNSSH